VRVIKRENIRPFDVDGCLIVRPEQSDLNVSVYDAVTEEFIRVGVNRSMVRLLMEERQRGSYIEVWSRSGWEWAENVVRALGLVDHVDLVKSKPTIYFDDTPIQDWLKDRVFIGPEVEYKR
jgi:hypothetical protein